MALIGITTVVLSLAVVVNIGASSLREKDLEYQAREQNLEKLEAKEVARTAQLEEYRVYVQTKQYVEKVAKESWAWSKKTRFCLRQRNPGRSCHGIFYGLPGKLTNISP